VLRLTADPSELIVLIVIHCFAAGDFSRIELADGTTGGGFNAWKQRVDRRRPRADDAIFRARPHCYFIVINNGPTCPGRAANPQ
jgi:hypothetical protein